MEKEPRQRHVTVASVEADSSSSSSRESSSPRSKGSARSDLANVLGTAAHGTTAAPRTGTSTSPSPTSPTSPPSSAYPSSPSVFFAQMSSQSKSSSLRLRFTKLTSFENLGLAREASGEEPARAHASMASNYARTTLFSPAAKAEDEVTLGELITFAGCEDLLRASSLTTIMRRQASIFRGSKGSNRTYELSRPVDHIDVFTSHNWDVGRWSKFLGLSQCFSMHIAAAATALWMVFVCIGNAAGWFPVFENLGSTYIDKSHVGIVCQLTLIPVFFLSTFFSQDVRATLGLKSPTCFLDKTCIHQVDPVIQRQGINRLLAFLAKSNCMVVLYTDTYLQRLWTVYEIAGFLATKPLRELRVVPLHLAIFFYTVLFLIWVNQVIQLVLSFYFDANIIRLCIWYVISPICMWWTCRQWAASKASIRQRLAKFSVTDCCCAVESDRDVVSRNIAMLMRAKVAGPDVEDKKALEMFDEMVRRELPGAFLACFENVSLRYFQVIVISLQMEGMLYGDASFGKFASKESIYTLEAWQDIVRDTMNYLIWALLVLPLLYAGTEYTSGCFIHLTGWKSFVWFSCSIVMLAGTGVPQSRLIVFLTTSNDIPFFVSVGAMSSWALVGGIVLYFVFRSRQSKIAPASDYDMEYVVPDADELPNEQGSRSCNNSSSSSSKEIGTAHIGSNHQPERQILEGTLVIDQHYVLDLSSSENQNNNMTAAILDIRAGESSSNKSGGGKQSLFQAPAIDIKLLDDEIGDWRLFTTRI